jgi:hypothetical protein
MAYSQPAALADFFNTLPVQEVEFGLERQAQINNLAGGEILSAEVAPSLWGGTVYLAPMPKRAAAQVQAYLADLSRPGNSFEVTKPHQIGPAADPSGAGLAGATPSVAEVDATNAHRLRLAGLPSDYALTPGDFLAFTYDPGTSPRRAFHQVVEGQASGLGGAQADFMRVQPEVRAGTISGAVALLRPAMLAVLVPGSVAHGTTRGNVTFGLAFSFRQTLRA